MEVPEVINSILFALLVVAMGWVRGDFTRRQRETETQIKDLTKRDNEFREMMTIRDRELSQSLHRIELLISQSFVPRSEFERVANSIFAKFERQEERIDQKQDKGHSFAGRSHKNTED